MKQPTKFYRHQLKSYLPIMPEVINISGHYQNQEIRINDIEITPTYSQRITNHSPDGFNWGYTGSGPAQLALSILMEYLPVEVALTHYQAFKNLVVSTWPKADFDIDYLLRAALTELAKPED